MRAWICLFLFFCGSLGANEIKVVAAENFYGSVAKAIGGDAIHVTSILNNPLQDPHLFSNSPATAKVFSEADIIIYNGLDYDPWAKKLVEATKSSPIVIIAADVLGKKEDENPHIWYEPKLMPLLAEIFCQKIGQKDPQKAPLFVKNLEEFKRSYQPFLELIAKMKEKYSGVAICATEPLFNFMSDAIGLEMKGLGFQISIMNETQPKIADIRSFEKDLKEKKVKALIYNTQVSSNYVTKMVNLAKKNQIPAIGMSELEPAGKSYVEWMVGQLQELERVLK